MWAWHEGPTNGAGCDSSIGLCELVRQICPSFCEAATLIAIGAGTWSAFLEIAGQSSLVLRISRSMANGGGKVRRILGIGQRICAASASRHLSEYSGFLGPRCQVARQVGQPKCQLVAGPLRITVIAFVEAARKEATRSDQESLEKVGNVTCCSYDLHALGGPLPPPWLGKGGGHGGQHDQTRLNGAERRPRAKPLSSGLPQVLQRRRKLLGTHVFK